jgi:hypothetical protein
MPLVVRERGQALSGRLRDDDPAVTFGRPGNLPETQREYKTHVLHQQLRVGYQIMNVHRIFIANQQTSCP